MSLQYSCGNFTKNVYNSKHHLAAVWKSNVKNLKMPIYCGNVAAFSWTPSLTFII